MLKIGGDFSGECNFLNEAFNLTREPIYEYTIPESEKEIPNDAFNGCVFLKKLVVHLGVKTIGKRAFEGIDFKYAYRLNTGELVFSQEVLENQKEAKEVIELEKVAKSLSDFDYSILLQEGNIEKISNLSKKLNKDKIELPYVYVKELINNEMIDAFLENSDFRFFRNEMPNINDTLLDFPEEERLDFFKFAKVLGCFSTEKIVDKKGRETNVLLAQKASALLVHLLKTEELKLGNYHELFDSMPMDIESNQKFLSFITTEAKKEKLEQDGQEKQKSRKEKREFINLKMMMNLEKNYPGMLVKVMSDFEYAKSFRESLDEEGKPIKVSWEDALKSFYESNRYQGITEENRDIATLFGSKGISQEIFDQAVDLRQEAEASEIPKHILGKELKEETILDSIERIKRATGQQLESGKQMIEELYNKQFSYEWLNKQDPHNNILGLFCNCCATIANAQYGKDIAKASITEPDVQNLVVRNAKGEIIAKGTMYLNQKRGYGVINDFELKREYRNHEIEYLPGRYKVEETSEEEQERNLIFQAFQRGLQAFIEEYDKQNPNHPIKQVNVGMGYNRLKKQVEQFKKATSNLSVPIDYSFEDARKEQRVLYKRKTRKKEAERGGNEK